MYTNYRIFKINTCDQYIQRGLSCPGYEAAARRRDQDPAWGIHRGSGSHRPLPARSRAVGRAQPPQRCRCIRDRRVDSFGLGAFDVRDCPGTRGRRDACGAHRARTDRARRDAVDRAADRRCARGGARPRCRASRPEAREHQDHSRRQSQSARFRPREDGGTRGVRGVRALIFFNCELLYAIFASFKRVINENFDSWSS